MARQEDEKKRQTRKEGEKPRDQETSEEVAATAAQESDARVAAETLGDAERDDPSVLTPYKDVRFEISEQMRYEPEEVWFPLSENIAGWDTATHELYVNDALRMRAYEKGIGEAVRRGDIVVDLGTGTGILAELALRAGAGKVYGIEFNPKRIREAQKRIQDAGLSDRFEVVQGLSYDVDLPQRADLVISEILGNLGDNEDMVPILRDARERFLRPDGKFLPKAVEVFLVPVSSTKAHDQVRQQQCRGLTSAYSLQELLERRGVTNQFNLYYDVLLPSSTELDEPQLMQRFNFDGNDPTEYTLDRRFVITRDGVFTGFKGFFKAELSDNITLDISGDDISKRTASDNWKHSYLPVEQAFPVKKGDVIELTYARREPQVKKATEFNQCYSWEGRILRDNQVVHTFNQRMCQG